MIQKLKGDGKTFAQQAVSVLSLALHEGTNSQRIDGLLDVYWEHSIKNAERCHRGSTSGTQWKTIAPGHNILHWRKFFSNPESKRSLIRFLTEQWKQPTGGERLGDK